MGGGLACSQLLRLGMLGIVVLINLQYFPAPEDHQGSVYVHAQHFVHRHQLPLAHTAGLPVLRGVIGNTPCTQLLGLAGDSDGCFAGAVGNKLCSQGVGAAQKQGDVAVTQNFLPLVIGIAVLESCEILEHAGHADVPGADNRDFPREVGDDPAGAQLLAQHMDRNGERTARTVLVGVAHQLDKDERQKQ